MLQQVRALAELLGSIRIPAQLLNIRKEEEKAVYVEATETPPLLHERRTLEVDAPEELSNLMQNRPHIKIGRKDIETEAQNAMTTPHNLPSMPQPSELSSFRSEGLKGHTRCAIEFTRRTIAEDERYIRAKQRREDEERIRIQAAKTGKGMNSIFRQQ